MRQASAGNVNAYKPNASASRSNVTGSVNNATASKANASASKGNVCCSAGNASVSAGCAATNGSNARTSVGYAFRYATCSFRDARYVTAINHCAQDGAGNVQTNYLYVRASGPCSVCSASYTINAERSGFPKSTSPSKTA
jgi:hypothetical protein